MNHGFEGARYCKLDATNSTHDTLRSVRSPWSHKLPRRQGTAKHRKINTRVESRGQCYLHPPRSWHNPSKISQSSSTCPSNTAQNSVSRRFTPSGCETLPPSLISPPTFPVLRACRDIHPLRVTAKETGRMHELKGALYPLSRPVPHPLID